MRVAVVGGGISGLVAAYRLRTALGEALELTLVERSERVGGILYTGEIDGEPVDLGAEAFVGRRPEIPALLRELGLEEQLVFPAGLRPLIWSRGTAHPLPERTLMGIPAGPDAVAGLVDEATLARIADEPSRPLRWERGDDVSVGTLVAERFGEQVVRRSVDPLLGGVYAGLADTIGVRAALPTLAAALDAGAPNLSKAVADALPPPSTTPVFGGIRDGYRALLNALLDVAAPKLETATAATTLERTARGWRLEPIGEVDAVILATPAPVTARLLRVAAPDAARAAAGIELSSSALVALALPADTPLPDNSGILVATGEPLRAKAFTLSSRKWTHLAQRDVALVRASFGRFGDDAPLSWTDTDLIAAATGDLATVTGLSPRPLTALVQRWPGGLPQYAPGHLDRIAAIEASVAELPRLAVAGAYLHGVGVPACAASGTTAAQRILSEAS
ncbi:protoporphyrinogen oxidase [Nocardia pseudobrasiliensis]|uniref:Oxygen-dependent protoporphyrinogen oxidase n=1 Tax=Nocardia pseudobrasiliensis TaxID=45979 RepID=A0A370I1N8_9NOCA|nr:protoporphyrinogen oxidase [Nocardia pseudobrasiliensis]RDI64655.1 oxygen-dependent protoporphyrinogen oxidase [Nocardia pseudobrasiliensis]